MVTGWKHLKSPKKRSFNGKNGKSNYFTYTSVWPCRFAAGKNASSEASPDVFERQSDGAKKSQNWMIDDISSFLKEKSNKMKPLEMRGENAGSA